eukprot:g2944.t1
MKDEQLIVLQGQNKKLLETITEMEEEVADAKHKLGEVETAALRVQDENVTLKAAVRRAEDDGRISAEQQFRQQLEASQHQIKVMAEQNTELLRLLETEENKSEACRKQLKESVSKYKAAVTELSLVRGDFDEQIGQAREDLKNSQQRERELNAELGSVREQLSGSRMKMSSLEEKLVKVSQSNVELNSRLLDFQRNASNKEMEMQENADSELTELRAQVASLETERDIERRDKERYKEEVKDQADQLKEVAEKVFQLIDRLKVAEAARKPAEENAERLSLQLRETKGRILKLETERAEADKLARRFNNQLKKCQAELADAKKKVEETIRAMKAEKELRITEQQSKKDAEEARKALSGRVSYLMNKSALDEESRMTARVDVKRLEKEVHAKSKEAEQLRRKLRQAQEAVKVLTESMRIKSEEIERLHVESKQRAWDEEAKSRAKNDAADARGKTFGSKSRRSKRAQGGSARNGNNSGASSSLMKGTGYATIMQLPRGREKSVPGLRAENNDARAKKLLKKMQVNEFLRYIAKRPQEKFLPLCVEKFAQILGALRVTESLGAAKARRAQQLTDRLRSELDMMRRKANQIADKLFGEEEAKRKALVKYLREVVSTRKSSGGAHPTAAINLADSGISDEEIHALVAVLTANDKVAQLDLRNNRVTDVGTRALAALLRKSENLVDVDLRCNQITPTGVRILAEGLEHNSRVRHVFVHGNGRIEGLGMVADAGAPDGVEGKDKSDGDGDDDDDDDDDGVVDTVLMLRVSGQVEPSSRIAATEEGLVDTPPRAEAPARKVDPIDEAEAQAAMAREREAMKNPLAEKIRQLENGLGPRALGPPRDDIEAEHAAELEAEKWVGRASTLEATNGLTEVPVDWLATETAPAAYESPLTKRIRDLESKLAIGDLEGEPITAEDMVRDIAQPGGEHAQAASLGSAESAPSLLGKALSMKENAAKKRSGNKRATTASSKTRSKKGVRRSKSSRPKTAGSGKRHSRM